MWWKQNNKRTASRFDPDRFCWPCWHHGHCAAPERCLMAVLPCTLVSAAASPLEQLLFFSRIYRPIPWLQGCSQSNAGTIYRFAAFWKECIISADKSFMLRTCHKRTERGCRYSICLDSAFFFMIHEHEHLQVSLLVSENQVFKYCRHYIFFDGILNKTSIPLSLKFFVIF